MDDTMELCDPVREEEQNSSQIVMGSRKHRGRQPLGNLTDR